MTGGGELRENGGKNFEMHDHNVRKCEEETWTISFCMFLLNFLRLTK